MSTIESTQIIKGYLVQTFDRMKAYNENKKKFSLAHVQIKNGEGAKIEAWMPKKELARVLDAAKEEGLSDTFFNALMVDVSETPSKIFTAPNRHTDGIAHQVQNVLMNVVVDGHNPK